MSPGYCCEPRPTPLPFDIIISRLHKNTQNTRPTKSDYGIFEKIKYANCQSVGSDVSSAGLFGALGLVVSERRAAVDTIMLMLVYRLYMYIGR